jgi:acetyl-CoA carboxylase biotin carboxyl carrier protein
MTEQPVAKLPRARPDSAMPGPPARDAVPVGGTVETAVEEPAEGAEGAESAPHLDAVCRALAEVVRTVPGPMRRVRVSVKDTTVELEWPQPVPEAAPAAVMLPAQPATPAQGGPPQGGPAAPPPHAAAPDTGTNAGMATHLVRAPMVGTFYHAPEPGAKPFVAVGEVVAKGQPVGIVEAMKLMNLIEADVSGTVVEVLVPSGAPVEFDQPLVALAPDTA